MIGVAILTILGALAISKGGKAVDRAKDATTMGNLASIRAAVTMYAVMHDGVYPSFPAPLNQTAGYGTLLTDALVPTYLAKMPDATPSGGYHKPSSAVGLFWNFTGNADDEENGYGAGWEYDANPHDMGNYPVGGWGSVRVMCKHPNAKGVAWSMY